MSTCTIKYTSRFTDNLLLNLKGIKSEDLESIESIGNLPKNGIEELLKASNYAPQSPKIEDME